MSTTMVNISRQKTLSVCFIAPKAYPLFNPAVNGVFGGAEVDLYYLAGELAKDNNFKVSFITADYGQEPVETIDNITVIKSLDFKKNLLTGARCVWRALKRADADIYMLETASLGVPLALSYCRCKKRKFVYRTANTRECDGTYLKEHYFIGKLFSWSLRRADILLAQNAEDTENLERTIGASPIVIANAQPLPKPEPGKKDYILWVGRSAKVKGPYRFIEFAKRFPNEKFVMICQKATGDEDYDELVEAAEAVGNLEFHLRSPFHKVESFFRRAKIFVNTSDSEGFPNTFIQAGKSATPILSFAVNPDGFLDEYSCGMSCGGDTERLAENLKFMLAEDRYIELGRNGRKYVAEHHDITKIVDKYKEIFTGLLRSGEKIDG